VKDWEDYRPRFIESPLCLKQHGPNKAIVVKIALGAVLNSSKARMYEVWIEDRKIYDPSAEYRVGQVLKL
jgi:hypothetical protein